MNSSVQSYDALSEQDRDLFKRLMYHLKLSEEDEVIKLVDAGAPLHVKDTSGTTPLHMACERGLEQAALAMVAKGAPLDVKDFDKNMPLHWACRKGLEQAALAMIARGAPLDVMSELDYTPLHWACLANMERVALAMIAKGASLTAEDTVNLTPLQMLGNADDMYGEFYRSLLLPALAMEMDPQRHDRIRVHKPDLDAELLEDQIADWMHPLPHLRPEATVKLSDADEAALMRRMRLSRTWHHAGVQLPAKFKADLPNRTWQPLLPEPFEAPNGLRIECLTNTEALKEETRALDHCVGRSDYDVRCSHSDATLRSHILSIRDAEGIPLSTAELRQDAKGDLEVYQHEGFKGKNPPAKAQQALADFLDAVKAQKVKLTPMDQLGEIHTADAPSVLTIRQMVGYNPSWEMINQVFDEYKMPYRRASLPTEGRRLEYDDVVTEDGYHYAHHFIDGYVLLDAHNVPVKGTFRLNALDLPERKAGQKTVSVRELDAKSYLRATGILDEIHNAMQNVFGSHEVPIKRWAKEAQEPVTFRPVPTPSYVIEQAQEEHISELDKDALQERQGSYLGQ